MADAPHLTLELGRRQCAVDGLAVGIEHRVRALFACPPLAGIVLCGAGIIIILINDNNNDAPPHTCELVDQPEPRQHGKRPREEHIDPHHTR